MNLLILGKEPINPDKPCGIDVRYEPEFEELQAEIDKLSSPSAAGGVDWAKVSKLAASILEQKSKDVLVASYLAAAQIYTAGFEGFLVGLIIYDDLLENFWQDLFPPQKRMRGRLAAIEWWSEKTETALKQIKPAALPPDKIEQARSVLKNIEALLQTYFEDPPSIANITRSINELAGNGDAQSRETDDQALVERPKPSPVRENQIEKPSPVPESEDIISEKDAHRVMRFSLQKIRQVSAFLFETDPTNALSYRYSRSAAWTAVETIPPAENGRTRITPPDENTRRIMQELRKKEDWESLLKSAERKVSQYIFFLDLNRYVAEALDGLGNSYQKAHDAVCRETLVFVKRLQGLEDLSFSDGSDFAEQKTREWLKIIGVESIPAMEEPFHSTEMPIRPDSMTETIKTAQGLASKKKLTEAIEILQQELRSSVSQKDRLLWRFALSEILLSSKQFELAIAHLEETLKTIEVYRLEEWEPELALRGLMLAWKGFSMRADANSKTDALGVMHRIAKLDLAQALNLVKK